MIKIIKSLEELSDEEFNALWDWEVELPSSILGPLYYYRSVRSADKILCAEKIELRLTRSDGFNDKKEGKTIQLYYQTALNELLASGSISDEWYNKFFEITVPEKMFLPVRTEDIRIEDICIDDKITIWEEADYEEYIICFSKVANDPNMFKRFCQKDDKPGEGYCFHFYDGALYELRTLGLDNHCDIKLYPVIYGESSIDYIKQNILKILGNDYYLRDYKYYICQVFLGLRYFLKEPKYADEHEIRLVVFAPKEWGEHKSFEIREEDNIKYLYLFLDKENLYRLTPSPANTIDQTQAFMDTIKDRGYELY